MGQRAPRAAAAAQLLLQDAVDASDVIGRWEYDVPNDRVYADALVALVFNLDPMLAQAGAPLRTFLGGVHPEDRARTARLIARSTEDGLACVIEYRVCSADGVTRWVLDRGRIALDGMGRPTRGHGILVDITQAKQAEAARVMDASAQIDVPLERAAEHCLAAHEAINKLPRSVLHQMSATMLLEIGRQLATLDRAERLGRLN